MEEMTLEERQQEAHVNKINAEAGLLSAQAANVRAQTAVMAQQVAEKQKKGKS